MNLLAKDVDVDEWINLTTGEHVWKPVPDDGISLFGWLVIAALIYFAYRCYKRREEPDNDEQRPSRNDRRDHEIDLSNGWVALAELRSVISHEVTAR